MANRTGITDPGTGEPPYDWEYGPLVVNCVACGRFTSRPDAVCSDICRDRAAEREREWWEAHPWGDDGPRPDGL